MGVVWRAEHPRHGMGALKLLRDERLADPAAKRSSRCTRQAWCTAIAIAGQGCYYEVRASDEPIMNRLLGSLRPIVVE